MGKKIFVSYKYADENVQRLSNTPLYKTTSVRDYVDSIENYLDASNHIYKGESDNEDLSIYKEDTIWEKLKDRIYDSSVTIVIISPNMKNPYQSDKQQWIPWEVAFSLRSTTRNDRTSHENAILAVILPDRNGSYNYYVTTNNNCGVTSYNTNFLFKILRDNMFNIKTPDKNFCTSCFNYHYYGESSYIESVKWKDFIKYPDLYIDKAVERQKNKYLYEITKNV
jgi:UDP-N-acetylmuramyl tripeptide synthase